MEGLGNPTPDDPKINGLESRRDSVKDFRLSYGYNQDIGWI